MKRDITLGALEQVSQGTKLVQWQVLPRTIVEEDFQPRFDYMAVTRSLVEGRDGTFIESFRSDN